MTDTAVAVLSADETLRGLQTVRTVLAPDLTDEELRLFAMVANRSGLDPFAKQVYAVKRQGRVTFQTGIDGYRSIAARTGMYDGQDEPEYGPPCACGDKRPEGHPESATVRVYRKGVGRPIAATAFWHEYKPEQGQSGRQDAMWVRMPRVMIAKVAEALALRKAFPYDPERKHGIGADVYTADEMAQADRTPVVRQPSLAERAAARRAEINHDDAANADAARGDVVSESPQPPAPTGLSREAFLALLKNMGVNPQEAAYAAGVLFPGRDLKALTDEERGELVRRMVADRTPAEAPSAPMFDEEAEIDAALAKV